MDDLAKYNKERWEERTGRADAAPGTWDHLQAVAPPYLVFWARKTKGSP